MAKWLLDPGHGGSNWGVSYDENVEKDDNLKIALKVGKILKNEGEDVYFTRVSDEELSLKDRINIGNSSEFDYFISFHRNSFSPESNIGLEIFYYSEDSKVKSLCLSIKENLEKIFSYRGTNKAELTLLKKIKAKGVLLELGFIDNTVDNKIFNTRIDDIANCIGRALLKEVGKVLESKVMWRICLGEFDGYEEAEKLMKEIRNLGYDASVIPLSD
ncbi:N-acetylmuramoyl-L-alanine amidase [Clostridium perfringens]|nr:N-acetylmuramoyl-L-alanine amidase [Clostridium perfringens]